MVVPSECAPIDNGIDIYHLLCFPLLSSSSPELMFLHNDLYPRKMVDINIASIR